MHIGKVGAFQIACYARIARCDRRFQLPFEYANEIAYCVYDWRVFIKCDNVQCQSARDHTKYATAP